MLNAGVAGFVLKASAVTDLMPAAQEVLRGGTYVCPTLKASPGTVDRAAQDFPKLPPTN
jgi:DNA-binding NarL/FixJ family response regulator